jgi:hypothetical protein
MKLKQLAGLLLALSAASYAQAQVAQDPAATADDTTVAPDAPAPATESSSTQRSMLPFMREIAGDHELPRPYGIGGDLFTMHQDYAIDSLSFALPGFTLADPSIIKIKNSLVEEDLKLDAWVFPFLNVFGIYGHLDAQTDVNLSAVTIPGLPVSLGTLPIRYNGSVYGGGLTLAAGGDHWFASVTGTWTRSSLSGDFDSKVKARTIQPRIGLVNGPWQFYVGAMGLHTDEEHSGVIALPFLGNVPFAVKLKQASTWSPSIGVHYMLDRFADVTLEFGGGDRRTTLLNVNLRFPRDN